MSRQFAWLSRSACPPPWWDLRRLGWRMVDAGVPEAAYPGAAPDIGAPALPLLLDCRPATGDLARQVLADFVGISPARVGAIGVDDPHRRARLLAGGVGEALTSNVGLTELAVRLARLSPSGETLPRHRMAGPVRLDLFHRDGRHGGRWLGLHPREFQLLWRLAQTPTIALSRRDLLREVWRLDHVPETNSLEVHVSRLRAKLAVFRLSWLVVTDPAGGYRLGSDPLDSRASIGDDGKASIQNESYVHAVE